MFLNRTISLSIFIYIYTAIKLQLIVVMVSKIFIANISKTYI